jgi:hypothetical protein
VSNENAMHFDVEAQLKQIELFTEEQRKEIDALLESNQTFHVDEEPTEAPSVQRIEQEVSGMIDTIESQLNEEMEKINQQLQSLLPNEVK